MINIAVTLPQTNWSDEIGKLDRSLQSDDRDVVSVFFGVVLRMARNLRNVAGLHSWIRPSIQIIFTY